MRNANHAKTLMTTYKFPDGESPATLYENFQRGVRLYGDRPCLGSRMVMEADGESKGAPQLGEFEFMTYNDVQKQVMRFGSGMISMDLAPAKDHGKVEGTFGILGLYMKNRFEWVVAEQACNAWSKVTCPLYDTLGVDAAKYSMNLTQMETVVCSKDLTMNVLKCAAADPEASTLSRDSETNLKYIVQCEAVDSEGQADSIELGKTLGVQLISFKDVVNAGKENLQEVVPPKADDPATICFTSGTTGNPKGVLLTHGNLIATTSGAMFSGMVLNKNDVHLSYLPLAHMFERAIQCAIFCGGARIGFYCGDTKKILDDIKALSPTIFPSVPRLYNKIYDKINMKVAAKGGIGASIFHTGLEAKKYWLDKGYYNHSVFDAIVFNKAKAGMGLGNVRIMITGAAPISAHVLKFLRCFFSCPVVEGYGQTETAAAATISVEKDTSLAHVGGPLACTEIALVSVPEMGYNCTDKYHGRDEKKNLPGIPCLGRGEICFRGNNTFRCYFKNPEKTAGTIDSDNWVHSGDIGIWLPNGCLKIVDRKKNIFKLAQGEYVAAEKLENIYCKSMFIAQMFVHGDSLHSSLCGLITPDVDYIAQWMGSDADLKDLKKADGRPDMEALCKHEKMRKVIKQELATLHKDNKLHGFERIRYFHLNPTDFGETTPKLLTPTFKLKRKPARDYFEKEIEEMYSNETIGGQNVFQK